MHTSEGRQAHRRPSGQFLLGAADQVQRTAAVGGASRSPLPALGKSYVTHVTNDDHHTCFHVSHMEKVGYYILDAKNIVNGQKVGITQSAFIRNYNLIFPLLCLQKIMQFAAKIFIGLPLSEWERPPNTSSLSRSCVWGAPRAWGSHWSGAALGLDVSGGGISSTHSEPFLPTYTSPRLQSGAPQLCDVR